LQKVTASKALSVKIFATGRERLWLSSAAEAHPRIDQGKTQQGPTFGRYEGFMIVIKLAMVGV
jgi:hypothetical protein